MFFDRSLCNHDSGEPSNLVFLPLSFLFSSIVLFLLMKSYGNKEELGVLIRDLV